MQTLRKFVGTTGRNKDVAKGDVGDTEKKVGVKGTGSGASVAKSPRKVGGAGRAKVEAQGDGWEAIKTRLSPAVVAIEMTYPRPFGFASSEAHGVASGFVVDKEKGIILTNKHVIQDGPIRATAEFLMNEKGRCLEVLPGVG